MHINNVQTGVDSMRVREESKGLITVVFFDLKYGRLHLIVKGWI